MSDPHKPGDRIAGYRIECQIGRGGRDAAGVQLAAIPTDDLGRVPHDVVAIPEAVWAV